MAQSMMFVSPMDFFTGQALAVPWLYADYTLLLIRAPIYR